MDLLQYILKFISSNVLAREFILWVSVLLLFPLVWKINRLFRGRLFLNDFFNKGIFFDVAIEYFLVFLGIVFAAIYINT